MKLLNITKNTNLLCAAFAAAFLSTACTTKAEQPSSLAAQADSGTKTIADQLGALLGQGGYALVMRHGKSPYDQTASVGLSHGCILADGRGLNPAGFAEARAMGAALAEADIPILKAYTSDLCRAFDTASLVAGGAPAIPHPAQKTTNPALIAAFKKEVEAELAANPGTNIILASHSNVAPLYGAAVRPGEEELPEGVVSIVDPASWQTIARITITIPGDPMVTLD